MGNRAAGVPGTGTGSVSATRWFGRDMANCGEPQIPYPLLSIRPKAQGQQSLRLRVDGQGIACRKVADSTGGKRLIIEGGRTAFACDE